MRAGTTCSLGVDVAGALFSLGDGHARQGEGETCGTAVECATDTVLVVELLTGRSHSSYTVVAKVAKQHLGHPEAYAGRTRGCAAAAAT